ncbi:hypothetical protein Vi05172_g7856 [Venturia inaequalis]|nr:hypothetical protein Vi05172_g7856 [Venturia inaequalis]
MDFLGAEERPDFTTAEYRETLKTHRQSDFSNFFENEFEVAMEERDDLEMQSDLAIDFFAAQVPLTLRPKSNDALMVDTDDETTMDLDEDAPTNSEAPKGFLDLPRELRQTIIYLSHENKEVDMKDWYEAYKYVDWANVLRKVHPLVEEDLNYVERYWNKRLIIHGLDCVPERNVRVDRRDVPHPAAAQSAEDARLRELRDRIRERGRDPTLGSSSEFLE